MGFIHFQTNDKNDLLGYATKEICVAFKDNLWQNAFWSFAVFVVMRKTFFLFLITISLLISSTDTSRPSFAIQLITFLLSSLSLSKFNQPIYESSRVVSFEVGKKEGKKLLKLSRWHQETLTSSSSYILWHIRFFHQFKRADLSC